MELKQEILSGTYEQRKKAFKAANPNRRSQHIPVTKNSKQWWPSRAGNNNRKGTNSRGVNPRMLNVQYAPNQIKVPVGTNKKNGQPVVALVKTTSMRKILHTRPYSDQPKPEVE